MHNKNNHWLLYMYIWFLVIAAVTAIAATVFIKQHKMLREKPDEIVEVVEVEPPEPPKPMEISEPQVIVIEIERPVGEKIIYTEPEDETVLDFSDIKLLASIVCAEAGNQDFVGKRLVVDVILNRYYDPDFPNTISEVIYQPGQFAATTFMGEYNEDDLEAVCMELNSRIDPNIFYFANDGYHDGTKAYQHGDHYFSYK